MKGEVDCHKQRVLGQHSQGGSHQDPTPRDNEEGTDLGIRCLHHGCLERILL
jgi:hypothetical protein